MDHSNCQSTIFDEVNSVTSFEARVVTWGCGCGKKVAGNGANIQATRRITVYEVQVNGNSVDEFASLPEARAKAVQLGGRVKVSSKVVIG